MGFPRQAYWSGLPFPSPGHLPDPGIKPTSPALAGGFLTVEPGGKPTRATRLGDSNSLQEEADKMLSSYSESSDLGNSHGEVEGNTPHSEETS